jgi:hypothetical protein
MATFDAGQLDSFEGPTNFAMPTARELEMDLALGSASWRSLFSRHQPFAAPVPSEQTVSPRSGRRPSPGRRSIPSVPKA